MASVSLSVDQVRYATAAQWTAADEILAKGAIGVESDTLRFKIGDGSTKWSLAQYAGGQGILASSVAASAAINTTETILAGGLNTAAFFPANSLSVGDTIRITLLGANTSSAANNSTFRARIGTAGTTSDGAAASGVVASAASGTGVPFRVVIEFTVRTLGASGTIAGTLSIINEGTTGIATTATKVVALSVNTINTTVSNYLSVTYVSAATTTTSTFQNAFIEWLKR